MSRLSRRDAVEFFETVYETAADVDEVGIVEGTIAGIDVQRAQADVESFLAAHDVDPSSITVRSDTIEGSGLDCVTITILTECGV